MGPNLHKQQRHAAEVAEMTFEAACLLENLDAFSVYTFPASEKSSESQSPLEISHKGCPPTESRRLKNLCTRDNFDAAPFNLHSRGCVHKLRQDSYSDDDATVYEKSLWGYQAAGCIENKADQSKCPNICAGLVGRETGNLKQMPPISHAEISHGQLYRTDSTPALGLLNDDSGAPVWLQSLSSWIDNLENESEMLSSKIKERELVANLDENLFMVPHDDFPPHCLFLQPKQISETSVKQVNSNNAYYGMYSDFYSQNDRIQSCRASFDSQFVPSFTNNCAENWYGQSGWTGSYPTQDGNYFVEEPAIMGMNGKSKDPLKPGDWICPNMNCRFHNFARRTSCVICGISDIGAGRV